VPFDVPASGVVDYQHVIVPTGFTRDMWVEAAEVRPTDRMVPRLPKGTRIECTAHFDNSPNNPENADPAKEVVWGEQSWDEMMVGFFNVVFDAKMPVENVLADEKNNAGIAKN